MKGNSTKRNPLAPGALGADPARIHEMIAKKAYELFERRGCQHGHHEEDWREAERLVFSQLEPVSELGSKPPSRRSSATRRQTQRR